MLMTSAKALEVLASYNNAHLARGLSAYLTGLPQSPGNARAVWLEYSEFTQLPRSVCMPTNSASARLAALLGMSPLTIAHLKDISATAGAECVGPKCQSVNANLPTISSPSFTRAPLNTNS